MSTEIILKALAVVRRDQIIATAANPATEDVYNRAFVYAVIHSVCPIFHETRDLITDDVSEMFPFHTSYNVPHETVEMIANMMDKSWLACRDGSVEPITFSDIEGPYKIGDESWPGHEVRNDLINICRYFHLHHMFDDDFWEGFMKGHPSEAYSIRKDWSREEILDWV